MLLVCTYDTSLSSYAHQLAVVSTIKILLILHNLFRQILFFLIIWYQQSWNWFPFHKRRSTVRLQHQHVYGARADRLLLAVVWFLFFLFSSPVPTAEGRFLLKAVFHRKREIRKIREFEYEISFSRSKRKTKLFVFRRISFRFFLVVEIISYFEVSYFLVFLVYDGWRTWGPEAWGYPVLKKSWENSHPCWWK